MTCKEEEILDLRNKKCLPVKSKEGNELRFLINVCSDYKEINSSCEEINKLYNNSIYKRLKKGVKNLATPISVIIAYNLIIVLLLVNKNNREKIASYIYKSFVDSNKEFKVINDSINIFNKVYTFISGDSEAQEKYIASENPSTLFDTFSKKEDIKIPGGWNFEKSVTPKKISLENAKKIIDKIL